MKKSFFEFLNNSKTAYHTVSSVADRLEANGYERLYECDIWNLKKGGKYFVLRDGSSIIAFRYSVGGFMIAASHSDSPAFRIKGDVSTGAYIKLETEKYGGMINYTWLDRPLTAAGRIAVKTESGVEIKLCDIGGKKVVIPSLAIHLNRGVNENCKLNPATDLIALASLGDEKNFFNLIAKSAGVNAADIISHEIFLVCADEAKAVGLNDELVLSPRLDDLACVYASLEGFLDAQDTNSTPVLAIFDNEEVGSDTKQGAASTFLYDVLTRVSKDREDYLTRLASSFMISADNAHALHSNHPELSDKSNSPVLGGGIVIKYNANQKYATDAVSDSVFRNICASADVKVQSYYNRADLPGGSTLGSISDTKVSLPTVDIGIPQLAMHSANETLAISDVCEMISALKKFYSSSLCIKGESISIK